MNAKDEFYIGWEGKAPTRTARSLRRAIVCSVAGCVILAASLAFAQRTIGRSVFEWGKVKEFSGVLKSRPYPHLLVARPGGDSFSSYFLVNPFKFGFDSEAAARWDGKAVALKGTLIYRNGQTMIEVVKGSMVGRGVPAEPLPAAPPDPIAFGEQTLIGEIVDSKCYLGVMNPGALTPHRACAIRCISGGIPPVLLVRQKGGPALYLLLVSADGSPVNKHVLRMVAEPVQITGRVERQGDMLILRADPATYRRLSKQLNGDNADVTVLP